MGSLDLRHVTMNPGDSLVEAVDDNGDERHGCDGRVSVRKGEGP